MTIGRIRRDYRVQSSVTIAAAVLALIVAGGPVLESVDAAPQETQPAFEVASIKRDVSGQTGTQFHLFPGFALQRMTLKNLITMAYEVHDFQVSGGPGWINSDRYNIEAKSEGNPVLTQEYRVMQLRRLQALLRDRFQLALHRETKELAVYELTAGRGGIKLQPLRDGSCIPFDFKNPAPAPGKTPMDYCGFGGFTGSGRYQASNGSMADLAGALSLVLGRTVVDKTGITGRFRMELTFAPNSLFPDAGGPDGPPDTAPTADPRPDIVTALQEQVGLRLESGKGPVEVLVIDRVEKPSEN